MSKKVEKKLSFIGLFEIEQIFIVKRNVMEQLLIAVAICIFYPFAKQGLQEIILDLAEVIAWILGKIIK